MRLRASALLLVAALGAPAAAVELDAEEREALAERELLVQRREPTGGKGVAFRVLRVLEPPVARVWPVVRDCALFEEFMPRVRESAGAEDPAICSVVIDSAPVGALRTTVRSEVEPVGDGWRRRWELVEGDYDHNRGSWTVVPWSGGGSLVVYEVDAEPRVPLPSSVLALAQRLQLPAMFDAIERRASISARPAVTTTSPEAARAD